MLTDTEQTQYIINKITRILERTIDTIRYQLRQGEFRPNKHEHSFSREIMLDDGMMELSGRIDRVDLYSEGDRIYVRIVDYKSSDHSIDITNVYHGIEQQLPLYMAEAVYHERRLHPDKEVIPAAMFYYHITDPFFLLEDASYHVALYQQVTYGEKEYVLFYIMDFESVMESLGLDESDIVNALDY